MALTNIKWKVNKPQLQRELQTQLNARIGTSAKTRIQNLLRNALKQHEVYRSLLGEALYEAFGLHTAPESVDAVVEKIVSDVNIYVTQTGTSLATIRIEAIKDNYLDLLNIPEALVQTRIGDLLPWLKWLLDSGTSKIADYHIVRGGFPRNQSRTGRAIMRKGGSWSVSDDVLASSHQDNWITQSIETIEPELIKLLKSI